MQEKFKLHAINIQKIIKKKPDKAIWGVSELVREFNNEMSNSYHKINNHQLSIVLRTQKKFRIYKNTNTHRDMTSYIFIKSKERWHNRNVKL